MKILLIMLLFSLSLTGGETLTIGSVADDPSREFKEFGPFLKYIKDNTASLDAVNLKIYKSISAVSQALNKKEVDLYIDSPFSVKAVCLKTNSIPLWRRWKKGSKDYKSVIFTSKESAISKLEDLKGKVIAFEERYSSSSYLLPKYLIQEAGIELVELKDPDEIVPPDKIGYIFTLDDATSMFWVLRKKVTAAAMSNKSYVKEAKKRITKLNILKQSKAFPRHVICLRPNFSKDITAELEQVLINMHNSKSGQAALTTFSKTAKIDVLPEENKKDISLISDFIKSEFNIK
jgi:phosphonate transport system substrate-binding protein